MQSNQMFDVALFPFFMQIIVTIFLVANLSVQIFAGVPDCIHANEGYSYPKPAVQLTEGINTYSVSPSIATYTTGSAVKYSALEESEYTSVTPGPIVKQVYSAPVVTKSYVAPAVATVSHGGYGSYVAAPTPIAYTAPLSKIATYTPTSNFVVPAVKKVAAIPAYQYPRITPGYLPPAAPVVTTNYVSSNPTAVTYVSSPPKIAVATPAVSLATPTYSAPIVTKYAAPAIATSHGYGSAAYGYGSSYGLSNVYTAPAVTKVVSPSIATCEYFQNSTSITSHIFSMKFVFERIFSLHIFAL